MLEVEVVAFFRDFALLSVSDVQPMNMTGGPITLGTLMKCTMCLQ